MDLPTPGLTAASSSSSVAAKTSNPLGKVYNDLLFRGRGGNKLSLGDLRKLLQECKTKDDVKYGAKLVEVFQEKGQDFSEEVNSHFVAMCIRGEQPLVAVKQFSKYKNRIGAWTTPKSFHSLVTSALTEKDAEVVKELAAALDTMTSKGVKVNADTVGLLYGRSPDAETYTRIKTAASRCLTPDAAAALESAHPPPAPTAPAPEAVAEAAAPEAVKAT